MIYDIVCDICFFIIHDISSDITYFIIHDRCTALTIFALQPPILPVTPLSHTASRTIRVLDTPPPTRSGTGAAAAGSTRGISGCGATVGIALGWCLIAEVERIRSERLIESRIKAAETRKRHSEAAAAAGAAEGCGEAD
jgi:hypothetical protein